MRACLVYEVRIVYTVFLRVVSQTELTVSTRELGDSTEEVGVSTEEVGVVAREVGVSTREVGVFVISANYLAFPTVQFS